GLGAVRSVRRMREPVITTVVSSSALPSFLSGGCCANELGAIPNRPISAPAATIRTADTLRKPSWRFISSPARWLLLATIYYISYLPCKSTSHHERVVIPI